MRHGLTHTPSAFPLVYTAREKDPCQGLRCLRCLPFHAPLPGAPILLGTPALSPAEDAAGNIRLVMSIAKRTRTRRCAAAVRSPRCARPRSCSRLRWPGAVSPALCSSAALPVAVPPSYSAPPPPGRCPPADDLVLAALQGGSMNSEPSSVGGVVAAAIPTCRTRQRPSPVVAAGFLRQPAHPWARNALPAPAQKLQKRHQLFL